MFWKNTPLSIAVVTIAMAASQAHAALEDRGGGMIYDTVNNVTWLADMNSTKTNGVDSDGLMSWTAAKAWAENLSYGGFDDWRLPTLNPFDTSCSSSFTEGDTVFYDGFGCTGGELSHLFVADLGNKAGESVFNQTGDTAQQKANLALFKNIQVNEYWSGTPLAIQGAWFFATNSGLQGDTLNDAEMFAVAVRSGDVAAVPEPQTLAMMLVGMGLLAAAMRRRQA